MKFFRDSDLDMTPDEFRRAMDGSWYNSPSARLRGVINIVGGPEDDALKQKCAQLFREQIQSVVSSRMQKAFVGKTVSEVSEEVAVSAMAAATADGIAFVEKLEKLAEALRLGNYNATPSQLTQGSGFPGYGDEPEPEHGPQVGFRWVKAKAPFVNLGFEVKPDPALKGNEFRLEQDQGCVCGSHKALGLGRGAGHSSWCGWSR